MKNSVKNELSNKEKEELLKGKNYQDVEQYSSPLGIVYVYINNKKRDLYIKGISFRSVEDIEDLKNGMCLLTYSNGDKQFLRLEDMTSSWCFSFESYEEDTCLCISKYGFKAKFNEQKLTLGNWYPEEV